MVKIVKSPGSATIINAIATGYGSAFGIDLSIIAEARLGKPGIHCSSDLGADPKLMNICVKNVLNHYDIAADNSLEDSITNLDFGTGEGIEIKTESNLPLGSGLSSSSALSNAVVKAASSLIESNFNLKPLSDIFTHFLRFQSTIHPQHPTQRAKRKAQRSNIELDGRTTCNRVVIGHGKQKSDSRKIYEQSHVSKICRCRFFYYLRSLFSIYYGERI